MASTDIAAIVRTLRIELSPAFEERMRALHIALSLMNNLEVNEQVLYARMIDVEQTTLII